MTELVQENKDLTNRLIDLALQNEDDVFNQAFGDDDEQPAQCALASCAAAASLCKCCFSCIPCS